MVHISEFSSEIQRRLGYYVYRLIDPRNGETFYVGKGIGNRLFAHVAGALADDGDSGQGGSEPGAVFFSGRLIRELADPPRGSCRAQ